MIGKQTKGRSFRGALNYLLGKDGAEIIGGNMVGATPRDLAAEFGAVRALRPNLERAVYPASLSLHPSESMATDRWREAADRYATEMGFGGSQYVVVRHHDTEHSHVHILASRIRLDGTVVNESHDYRRSEQTIRGIERDFGLTHVLPSRESPSRAPTSGELRHALREGKASVRFQLQRHVEMACAGRPSMSEFLNRLEGQNVQVIPHIGSTGRVGGITFSIGGERMKGSDLGRGFSWAGLQQRGITYEHDRDFQRLAAAGHRSGVGGPRQTDPGLAIGQHAGGNRFDRTPGTIGLQHGAPDRGRDAVHAGIEDVHGSGARQHQGGRTTGETGHDRTRRDRQDHHRETVGVHDGGGAPRLDGSRERLLRLAAGLLGRQSGGGKMAHVREHSLSEARQAHAGDHSADLAMIKDALKPFDDKHAEEERRRAFEREEQARQRALERAKSRGRGKGMSIDL